MATLGSKSVGSIVKLKVGGTYKEFIVVNQGKPSSIYDASCDGTWLLMEDCHEKRQWHSSNVNNYANSTIHTYLNGTFLNLFDADIKAQIKQVKIPYRAGSGYGTTVTSGANGLSAKIFLLSSTEASIVHTYSPVMGAELGYFKGCKDAAADTKRVANLNGSAVYWWLRDPHCVSNMGATNARSVQPSGAPGAGNCTNTNGVRPAFILPSTLAVNADGTVTTNTAPGTPPGIIVPAKINGGSTVTIEWTASSDAENNLEGYLVERSLDGGDTWTQIYQGSARSATNSVAFGLDTVMYRVRAYDSGGLYSGWRTSAQVTVVNNTAPTEPDGITVPEAVNGGQPLTITWGEAQDGEHNLAGYSLERQVDGGEWEEIYSGPELTFTDQVTKGWQTVDYRVRAYDTENAYSGYAAGEAREVNNNTPPEVTCVYQSGASMGEQNEPFAVSYSVRDEEGDPITVTEAIDGAAVRTFEATPEAEYTFDVSGATYLRVLNGTHTLTITAADGHSETVHRLTFSKQVTAASVTLEAPMEADGPISVCVLSVTGSIPLDAVYKVEVTNNGLDDAPVWQDCTAAVKAGGNVIFENKTVESTPAFNFRVSVERGASGIGGYITSVQGGFQ